VSRTFAGYRVSPYVGAKVEVDSINELSLDQCRARSLDRPCVEVLVDFVWNGDVLQSHRMYVINSGGSLVLAKMSYCIVSSQFNIMC
jgi:hypothetical protein